MLVGGLTMSSIFNSKKILRLIVIYLIIGIVAIGLSKVGFKENYFVFSIPFVLFCFLDDKWEGYFSFFVSYLTIGFYNKVYFLTYLLVLVGVILFRYILKSKTVKLEKIVSFYSFFLCLLESVLVVYINKQNSYMLLLVFSLISYWTMNYFFNIYKAMHSSEVREILPYLSSFSFFIIGLVFIGLNISVWKIDTTLILLVLLSFISSKISLEIGVVYGLLIVSVLSLYNGFSMYLLLFVLSSVLTFLLNKTSKITLCFTYLLVVGLLVHYYKLDYYISLNYAVGSLIYLFIPISFINKLEDKTYGCKQYIERLKRENKERNIKFSNKILKMEEAFEIVTSKLNIKERIKKNEKEILIDEIIVFDELLKKFASEINNDKSGSNKYYEIEKEIYKYNIDLLYFVIEENIFKETIIKINARCNESDINNILIPLISNKLNKRLEIIKVKENNIFEYKEITLKSIKRVNFNYGVGQIAKDKEVCGDSYLIYENEKKCYFAISDGMGIGKKAKEKSKLALDILKKFLDIGIDEKKAINSLNSVLKKKYSKDNYTTLDLLVYDKFSNKYSFYKNGACNSYVYNKEGVKVVEGNELPIGIIDNVTLNENIINLDKNDYLFMFSDGVSEDKLMIKDVFNYKDPQRMVREILKKKDNLDDDETVLVIKVK